MHRAYLQSNDPLIAIMKTRKVTYSMKQVKILTYNKGYWSETGSHLLRSYSHPKERDSEQVDLSPVSFQFQHKNA